MFDTDEVDVWEPEGSRQEIDSVLSELQRTSNNNLKKIFPTEFDPKARICLRYVETTTNPAFEFICVSWHGKHRNVLNESTKKI
ncbi:hypothetical protein DPMN_187342 [Dreissena polymorpha]|uniref:Uncharacterized protein n=1 Tax=Dreissena polymorpha TaxID=45954 RepID=A0A9D4DPZ9_DREPO|nr:hypothetical protein DPMN_187342 [Dreissena polymorpha]